MIELLLVLFIGNLITNMRIDNIECNSNYVGDQNDGDAGVIYICKHAKRMEYPKEGVLERTDTSNTQSNR